MLKKPSSLRKMECGLSPWHNNSMSMESVPSPKKVKTSTASLQPNVRKNRQNIAQATVVVTRKQSSSTTRTRYNSNLEIKHHQTLNIIRRPQSRQTLQELPVLNFVIQGGEQTAERSLRRQKFKSSFMVKHRLSLIRRDQDKQLPFVERKLPKAYR